MRICSLAETKLIGFWSRLHHCQSPTAVLPRRASPLILSALGDTLRSAAAAAGAAWRPATRAGGGGACAPCAAAEASASAASLADLSSRVAAQAKLVADAREEPSWLSRGAALRPFAADVEAHARRAASLLSLMHAAAADAAAARAAAAAAAALPPPPPTSASAPDPNSPRRSASSSARRPPGQWRGGASAILAPLRPAASNLERRLRDLFLSLADDCAAGSSRGGFATPRAAAALDAAMADFEAAHSRALRRLRGRYRRAAAAAAGAAASAASAASASTDAAAPAEAAAASSPSPPPRSPHTVRALRSRLPPLRLVMPLDALIFATRELIGAAGALEAAVRSCLASSTLAGGESASSAARGGEKAAVAAGWGLGAGWQSPSGGTSADQQEGTPDSPRRKDALAAEATGATAANGAQLHQRKSQAQSQQQQQQPPSVVVRVRPERAAERAPHPGRCSCGAPLPGVAPP